MTARRPLARVAFALLLALLVLTSIRPSEISRRARRIAGDARADLASRRLHGSSAAFDRRYFSFLENVRRRLPSSAAGVAIWGAPPGDAPVYLATYQLAPLPVAFGSVADDEIAPPGWLIAIYGPNPLPPSRVVATLPEGTLAR